jgi:MFS family permease
MGLIFLAAPVFTIGLAMVSGRLTDRIGPRIPASVGVLATMAAFAIGLFLRVDSHWIMPALMMALLGVGSGFFNTPNQTAIIGSVPREYRGFATGMVQTIFGISALLGISLGGVLLTLAFRYYSGIADATPSPAEPRAVRRGDERRLLRVPGADGVRALRVVPARRDQDRGGDLRYLISWREMSCVLMSSGSCSSASICKSVRPGGTTACGSPGSTPTKRLLVCSSLAHAI